MCNSLFYLVLFIFNSIYIVFSIVCMSEYADPREIVSQENVHFVIVALVVVE